MWVLLALGLSLNSALGAELNRYFGQDGFRLNFWRGAMATLMLFPAALLVSFPPPGMFYVAAMLAGTVMAVSPAIRMTLSARKFGRVSTLFMPVEAFVAFFLWLMLDPDMLNGFIESPVRSLLIFSAMVLVTISMAAMRRHDVGWQTFLVVAPLGVLHGLSGVLIKYAMPVEFSMNDLIAFMILVNIFAQFLSASFLVLRPNYKEPLCPPGMLRAALVYGVLGIMSQLFFYSSVQFAPSPGYVVAIGMLAPVWIMMYHYYVGLRDDANPKAGLLMVLAAMLLVLTT